ncbi:hypothetical protein [Rhodospirillum centenum]|uniref:hypothetical protein n=1 Tax=Rhodospirillum centenum TaxID=34018 RepID=UPI0011D0D4AD|nr:hypothetical protein [Rhodospirillum centenum]
MIIGNVVRVTNKDEIYASISPLKNMDFGNYRFSVKENSENFVIIMKPGNVKFSIPFPDHDHNKLGFLAKYDSKYFLCRQSLSNFNRKDAMDDQTFIAERPDILYEKFRFQTNRAPPRVYYMIIRLSDGESAIKEDVAKLGNAIMSAKG